jgi:hypothetical protein
MITGWNKVPDVQPSALAIVANQKIQKYDGIHQADQPASDCSMRRIALVEDIQLCTPVREEA